MRLYDYAASANCYKDRLLLSLLQREYERVPIDIFAGETPKPDQYGPRPHARRRSSNSLTERS